jgi:hypothetical protein
MESEYLMSIVSFVFQDVFLFKQSIMDNILIGNKNASREEAVAAAKAAQCHEFVEALPQGYDTVIGTKHPPFRRGTAAPRHRPGDPQKRPYHRARRGHGFRRSGERTEDSKSP